MLEHIRQLLAVSEEDPELIDAQFRAFTKQIPLLYFILAANTLALISTLTPYGLGWLTIYAPGLLVAICVARAIHWLRVGSRETSTAAAIGIMQTTHRLAFALAAVFISWGFLVFPRVGPFAQAQIVFFLGLTMISCIFCLTHLRAAALTVAFVGIVPFTVYFSLFSDGHFRAAALNLALVGVGMVAILLGNYRDFAHLVASRRALIDKQAETQRLSDENFRLANQDSLTGLANRRAFIARLRETVVSAVEDVAIAFVDLDGFKTVNDDLGHEAGDRLIVAAAEAFSELLPSRDSLLARLGGDEFAAAFFGADAERRAAAFGEAVTRRLERPLVVRERAHRLGASLGIASARPGEIDEHELLRRADVAMYDVKSRGKAGVRAYAPELDRARRRQHALVEEIRAGIAEHEFDLHYQPIVDARSHAVTSLEALLRWTRRPEGPMEPDRFIAAAEASGLIHPLGLFALRRACVDLRDFGDVKVSVNVSPLQFHDPGFEGEVARILAETNFPARRLSLELTESYLMDNPGRAAAAVATLKGMGVSMLLDDFGTGFASVAYLQRYGFDGIKIDRSLCSRIDADPKARLLVTGVVYLANGLDMSVTAEGVETEDHARLLRLIGCQHLQGYRFSAPKPLAALAVRHLTSSPTRAA